MIFQLLLYGLISGSLYAVGGMGFSIVYQTTRILHLVYAGLYTLGGYLLYLFLHRTSLPFGLTWLAVILLSCALSWTLDRFGYYYYIKKRSSTNILMVVSLALNIIIINLLALFFGNNIILLKNSADIVFHLGNILITQNQLIQFVTCTVIIIIFLIVLRYTSLGLKIRALKDNSLLLSVLGFDAGKVRQSIFLLSGFLIAIPATLSAYDVGITPYSGFPFLLNILVTIIIGGAANFSAPILGGFILGLIQAISVYFFEARWEAAATFVVLVLFLIFRPQGLVKERRRVA